MVSMEIEGAISFDAMESLANDTSARLLRLVATLALLGCHESTVRTAADVAPTLDAASEKEVDGPTVASPSDGAKEKEADGPNADALFDAAAEKWASADVAGDQAPDRWGASDAFVAFEIGRAHV